MPLYQLYRSETSHTLDLGLGDPWTRECKEIHFLFRSSSLIYTINKLKNALKTAVSTENIL